MSNLPSGSNKVAHLVSEINKLSPDERILLLAAINGTDRKKQQPSAAAQRAAFKRWGK